DIEGNIEYVNPATERVTGYPRDELIGRNPRIFKSGRQDEAFYRNLWETILRGEVWTGRLTNRCKDDALIEQQATISPIRDSSGKISGFVAVRRDVTEQVRLESQLVQTQKMEALGTLAGGIAHDFNNILGAILGYTEVALMDTPGDGGARASLGQVLKACERARNLVHQILTFSRKTEQERMPLEVGPIAKECLKFLRASLPATIELRKGVAFRSGKILADPTQIHQVIMNLCTNAAQAMRATGGVLELGLDIVTISGQQAHLMDELPPGDYQVLAISDTGPGMIPEVKNHIFEPFFTTKERGEGTGLGLSVVHGIVKGHGGTVNVYSEPGQGAVFKVYLPLVEGRKEAGPAPRQIPPPGGTERVLFVDDEASLVEVARHMLEFLGYDVTTFTDSREALEMFKSDLAAFDLVVTDQTMPKMTGAELAREMMALRPDLPIILCTGFSHQVDAASARALGIRRLLPKPFTHQEMAEKVREVLDESGPPPPRDPARKEDSSAG
ncbi:MAG: ATP-binding protein, partial [Thermodesulfobacteriota bacterium]